MLFTFSWVLLGSSCNQASCFINCSPEAEFSIFGALLSAAMRFSTAMIMRSASGLSSTACLSCCEITARSLYKSNRQAE